MKAILRQIRISPKKANLVAAIIRGMTVTEALSTLERLPKKGALFLHGLISSAVANAEHTAKQSADGLFIKTLIVNKGPAFKRSIPMARGRARPIDKWTSHISVELGVVVPEGEEKGEKAERAEKGEKVDKVDKVKEVKGEYSETKPATSFTAKGKEGVDDAGASDKTSEGGSATFQTQRKGSRGS